MNNLLIREEKIVETCPQLINSDRSLPIHLFHNLLTKYAVEGNKYAKRNRNSYQSLRKGRAPKLNDTFGPFWAIIQPLLAKFRFNRCHSYNCLSPQNETVLLCDRPLDQLLYKWAGSWLDWSLGVDLIRFCSTPCLTCNGVCLLLLCYKRISLLCGHQNSLLRRSLRSHPLFRRNTRCRCLKYPNWSVLVVPQQIWILCLVLFPCLYMGESVWDERLDDDTTTDYQ